MKHWIEWQGGERPVPAEVRVDFQLRGDDIVRSAQAGHIAWLHQQTRADVVRYRLSEERKAA